MRTPRLQRRGRLVAPQRSISAFLAYSLRPGITFTYLGLKVTAQTTVQEFNARSNIFAVGEHGGQRWDSLPGLNGDADRSGLSRESRAPRLIQRLPPRVVAPLLAVRSDVW
jgi:hypothetical protein